MSWAWLLAQAGEHGLAGEGVDDDEEEEDEEEREEERVTDQIMRLISANEWGVTTEF